MRKAMIIGALTLAGSLASPAFADEYTGVRLGIGFGKETMDSDIATLGLGATKLDTARGGYTVTGGWAMNKWLAFEGAYNGGSDFNQNLYLDPAFPHRDIAAHYDVNAFVGSVVGSWWVRPNFGVFGRAGVYAWKGTLTVKYDLDARAAFNPPGYQVVSFDDDGFEPIIGVGLQTSLDTAIIRLEYSMTQFDDHAQPGIALADTTVNSLSLGIVWTLH